MEYKDVDILHKDDRGTYMGKIKVTIIIMLISLAASVTVMLLGLWYADKMDNNQNVENIDIVVEEQAGGGMLLRTWQVYYSVDSKNHAFNRIDEEFYSSLTKECHEERRENIEKTKEILSELDFDYVSSGDFEYIDIDNEIYFSPICYSDDKDLYKYVKTENKLEYLSYSQAEIYVPFDSGDNRELNLNVLCRKYPGLQDSILKIMNEDELHYVKTFYVSDKIIFLLYDGLGDGKYYFYEYLPYNNTVRFIVKIKDDEYGGRIDNIFILFK